MGKYSTHVAPRLGEIAQWMKDGAELKEVAQRLEVGYGALRGWANKGEAGDLQYAPLSIAIALAKVQEPSDRAVEAALFKLATGYQSKEVTREEKRDRDGQVQTVTKTVTKDVPPHLASIEFILTNQRPQRWGKEAGGAKEAEEIAGVVELPAVKKPKRAEEKDG